MFRKPTFNGVGVPIPNFSVQTKLLDLAQAQGGNGSIVKLRRTAKCTPEGSGIDLLLSKGKAIRIKFDTSGRIAFFSVGLGALDSQRLLGISADDLQFEKRQNPPRLETVPKQRMLKPRPRRSNPPQQGRIIEVISDEEEVDPLDKVLSLDEVLKNYDSALTTIGDSRDPNMVQMLTHMHASGSVTKRDIKKANQSKGRGATREAFLPHLIVLISILKPWRHSTPKPRKVACVSGLEAFRYFGVNLTETSLDKWLMSLISTKKDLRPKYVSDKLFKDLEEKRKKQAEKGGVRNSGRSRAQIKRLKDAKSIGEFQDSYINDEEAIRDINLQVIKLESARSGKEAELVRKNLQKMEDTIKLKNRRQNKTKNEITMADALKSSTESMIAAQNQNVIHMMKASSQRHAQMMQMYSISQQSDVVIGKKVEPIHKEIIYDKGSILAEVMQSLSKSEIDGNEQSKAFSMMECEKFGSIFLSSWGALRKKNSVAESLRVLQKSYHSFTQNARK